jgi:uncharacterized repeat protein (TIGR01451 family)/CSLREA domain-containing protein
METLETRRLLATLVVTSTLDAIDLDPGDGVCEISAGGPCTLRAAIQEANSLANSNGPDQITLAAGTYTLSIDGTDEQQAATGDLDIREDLILEGAGAADTIIDAAGIDRALDIARGNVTISGITIRGGVIRDNDDLFEGSGGGIRNEDNLTIIASTVTGNISTIGAGIANYNGTLRISRSVISGNGDASTTRGGGVSNYANYDAAVLELTDTTISGNQAITGGGIDNRTYDGRSSATISRSTISGNTAGSGGGISNRTVVYYSDPVSSTLTIRGSTISGNVADLSGGAIHNETDDGGSAGIDIAGSTITANTATDGDGGGLFDVASDGVSTAIESVIISGNTAGGAGADLASDSATAIFSLIQDPQGHTIVDGADNNIVGQDPLLGPLASNGGVTRTHILLDGSPAVDQGSNPDLLANDQRGSSFARTVDDPTINNASDGTDIGAVEVGQVAATHDFGDAPDGITVAGTFRQYPTLLANNGARHRLTASGPILGGLAADAEPDGQPTLAATGDNLVGTDDEDGLSPSPIVLTPGAPLTGLSISHHGGTAGALLSAWIDLNLDGDWDDGGEQILTDVSVPAGVSSTPLSSITIPASTPAGTTFIRTRISTVSGLTPRGEASDGEVEDFAATVGTPPPQVADLSIAHTVNENNPALGQDVTFTVTLTNDGPDPATNVEVSEFLPLDLIFVRSTVSQGSYDDLDGIWSVGALNPSATAVLTVTATVDTTDPINVTAELSSADQLDPDSTPGNAISGEDDQFSVALGTCLAGGPLHVGMNQLTFSCAGAGSISAFVRGTERGSRWFPQHQTTVDIADAQVVSIAIADAGGVAVAFFELTDTDLDQPILVQAYEIVPGSTKSNTLSLESTVQMLRAATVGPGGLALQGRVLPAVIEAAISQWDAVGISGDQLATLRRAHVTISDLPGDAIGRVLGGTIVLDHDAAGNGWFVDSTPSGSDEFLLDSASNQYIANDPSSLARVDLVTALIHEFGHILGLPDLSDPGNVMHSTLAAGVRRIPTSNTNRTESLDVNDDNIVSPLDALMVINHLNQQSQPSIDGQSLWVGPAAAESVYLDTNGDYSVTTLDALIVINYLSRLTAPVASAEAAFAGTPLLESSTDSGLAESDPTADSQQAIQSFADLPTAEFRSQLDILDDVVGTDGYMSKPIRRQQLVTRFERCLLSLLPPINVETAIDRSET